MFAQIADLRVCTLMFVPIYPLPICSVPICPAPICHVPLCPAPFCLRFCAVDRGYGLKNFGFAKTKTFMTAPT